MRVTSASDSSRRVLLEELVLQEPTTPGTVGVLGNAVGDAGADRARDGPGREVDQSLVTVDIKGTNPARGAAAGVNNRRVVGIDTAWALVEGLVEDEQHLIRTVAELRIDQVRPVGEARPLVGLLDGDRPDGDLLARIRGRLGRVWLDGGKRDRLGGELPEEGRHEEVDPHNLAAGQQLGAGLARHTIVTRLGG